MGVNARAMTPFENPNISYRFSRRAPGAGSRLFNTTLVSPVHNINVCVCVLSIETLSNYYSEGTRIFSDTDFGIGGIPFFRTLYIIHGISFLILERCLPATTSRT